MKTPTNPVRETDTDSAAYVLSAFLLVFLAPFLYIACTNCR